MEQEAYQTPEVEIIHFETEDIITTSPGSDDLFPDLLIHL